jgi:hypothetical protein
MKKMLNNASEIRQRNEERRAWNRMVFEYVSLFVGFGLVGVIAYFVRTTSVKEVKPVKSKQEQVTQTRQKGLKEDNIVHVLRFK